MTIELAKVEHGIGLWLDLGKDQLDEWRKVEAKRHTDIIVQINGQKREFTYDEFRALIFPDTGVDGG